MMNGECDATGVLCCAQGSVIRADQDHQAGKEPCRWMATECSGPDIKLSRLGQLRM